MAPIYKQQEWLIYSGAKCVPAIGWPMAIAEAQAKRSDIKTNIWQLREA